MISRKTLFIPVITLVLCFSLGIVHSYAENQVLQSSPQKTTRHGVARISKSPSRTYFEKAFPFSTPRAALYVTDPTATDLLEVYPDIEISQDIIDLALSLNNSPLEIFQHVKNNYDYQIYPLSMKGSRGVFYDKSGNDMDLASFLMALYRAAGIPCRYEYGIVQISVEQARGWVGIVDDQTLIEAFQDGGISAQITTIEGRDYLEIAHIWIIAFVPYGNYRGLPLQEQENVWIHLDPSFKDYSYATGIDLSEEYPYTSTLESSYYSTVNDIPPIDHYYSQMQSYLDSHYPGETVESIKRAKSIPIRKFERILPCNPPYLIKQIYEPITELVDDHRAEVRVKLYDIGSNPYYDFTLPELYCKKLTLSFEAATPADQTIIDSYGGFFQTPPNLINIKPVISLDGTVINPLETNSCTPGDELQLTVTTTVSGFGIPTPQTSQLLGEHQIFAGELLSIHVDPPGTNVTYLRKRIELLSDNLLLEMYPFFSDEIAGEKLHIAGLDYFNSYEKDSVELGEVYHAPFMKMISEAITGQRIKVILEQPSGNPIGLQPVAQFIDVKHHVIKFYPADGLLNNYSELFNLDRMQGSFYEHKILDRHFDRKAISTVDYFQNAVSQGAQIFVVAPGDDFQAIFNQIDFDGIDLAEKNQFRDYLSWTQGFNGYTLHLPDRYLQKNDWRGYAWIEEKHDVGTEFIGNYALQQFWSVSASGGWTTEGIDKDPNCESDPGVSVDIGTSENLDIFYADDPFLFMHSSVETDGPPTYHLQWTSDLPVDPATTDSCCLTVYPSNITGRHWVEVTVISDPDGCNTDTQRFEFTTVLLHTDDFCPPLPGTTKKNDTKNRSDCPILTPIDQIGRLQEDIVIPYSFDSNGEANYKILIDILKDNKEIATIEGDETTQTALWPKGTPGLTPGTNYKIRTYIEGLRDKTEADKDLFVVRFTLNHQCNYEKLIPGLGDYLSFEAKVEPDNLSGNISFTLIEMSNLSGVCMNYIDPGIDCESEDYVFELSPDFNISSDGQFAESTQAKNEISVTLLSKDYGGYGKLVAFFDYIYNDTSCCRIQAIYDYSADYMVRIPFDYEPENCIADEWDKSFRSNPEPDSDFDGYSSRVFGAGLGDGLSRFEEYRGFRIRGLHSRTDPNNRDLFVYDKNSLGVTQFSCGAAGTSIHFILEDEFVNENIRIMNYYSGDDEFWRGGNQYGVRIVENTETIPGFGEYFWGETRLVTGAMGYGTPKLVDYLEIKTGNIDRDIKNCIGWQFFKYFWIDDILSNLISHELFHAGKIIDHGDGSVYEKWKGDRNCILRDITSCYYWIADPNAPPPPQDFPSYDSCWEVEIGKILCKVGFDCSAQYNINDNL